jgi:hypothetical protein
MRLNQNLHNHKAKTLSLCQLAGKTFQIFSKQNVVVLILLVRMVVTSACCFDLAGQNGSNYFGALVGRVANRVAGARFVLDSKTYHLFPNDGKNALHGTPQTRELLGAP